MPLIAFTLVFGMFVLPFIGSGPIWQQYSVVMQPCQKYWWTTLIYINNFYPANFDDRCLPFAWFIPCYVQLSLLLPLIMVVYRASATTTAKIFFASLVLLGMVINFSTTLAASAGALPV